jgi:hypothetical protein
MKMQHQTLSARRVAVVLLSLFQFVSGAYASAANACYGIGGNWHDSTGAYTFNQNAGYGTIDGLLTTNQGGQCNAGQHYTVAGKLSNGALSLTATWRDDGGADQNPRPIGCAQTIGYSGSVTGPGCTTADGNWSNSGGLHNVFHMVGDCIKPTTPVTTASVQFLPDSGYHTQALYQQTLQIPSGFNFTGRTMGEQFPVPGPNGCWASGAPFPQAFTHAPDVAAVANLGIPSVYDDKLALPDAWIEWIRLHQPALPCGFLINQEEYIDCTSSSTPDGHLQTNQLIFTVDNRTVRYSRRGVPSGDIVWGVLPPKFNLSAPLGPLLKK